MEQIAICEESIEKSGSTLSLTKAEARKKSCARMLQEHQVSSCGVRLRFSRIELSVVSRSNVGCNYCETKTQNAKNVAKVETAQDAIELVQLAAKSDPRLRVVSISGTGDPLGSEVTFETLHTINEEFPHFTVCIETDGLLLPKKLPLLSEAGVNAVSIKVNAVEAEVGKQIYSYVRLNGKTLRGREAFEVLSINQLEGLRNAADAGLMVKVNSAYIPGVNSEHLVEVAKIVRSLGAYVMDIVPLASQGLGGVTAEEMAKIRRDCADVCTSEVQLYTSPRSHPVSM
jgi:nitrogen fixation protein NifB